MIPRLFSAGFFCLFVFVGMEMGIPCSFLTVITCSYKEVMVAVFTVRVVVAEKTEMSPGLYKEVYD